MDLAAICMGQGQGIATVFERVYICKYNVTCEQVA